MDIWKEYRGALEGWVIDKGYSIDFVRGGDNSICSVSKYIEINSRHNLEHQVYYLLHECGHLLIFENGSKYNFREMEKKYSKKTNSNNIFVVIEESEAWYRGMMLGKRLGMEIDEKKWEKAMTRALKTYLDWAAN